MSPQFAGTCAASGGLITYWQASCGRRGAVVALLLELTARRCKLGTSHVKRLAVVRPNDGVKITGMKPTSGNRKYDAQDPAPRPLASACVRPISGWLARPGRKPTSGGIARRLSRPLADLAVLPARFFDGLPHRADGPGRGNTRNSPGAIATSWASAPTRSTATKSGSPRRAAREAWAGCPFRWPAIPRGVVCQAYGVYLPRQNMALRGLFIIDPNGVLQYQVVHNLSVGRPQRRSVARARRPANRRPVPRELGTRRTDARPGQRAGPQQHRRPISDRGADRRRHVRRGVSRPRPDARADRGAEGVSPRPRHRRRGGCSTRPGPRPRSTIPTCARCSPSTIATACR